jgi:hypothetical protein
MVGPSVGRALHVATWRYKATTCVTIQADPPCNKKGCFVEHINKIATGQQPSVAVTQ